MDAALSFIFQIKDYKSDAKITMIFDRWHMNICPTKAKLLQDSDDLGLPTVCVEATQEDFEFIKL